MTDNEFLDQFEACSLPKCYFNHQGHIRMTWLYLSRYPFIEAESRIITGIKKYAASLGASQIYHETMTKAWIRIIAKRMQLSSQINNFKDLIEQNQDLFNKDIISHYYSKALIERQDARTTWVMPDRNDF